MIYSLCWLFLSTPTSADPPSEPASGGFHSDSSLISFLFLGCTGLTIHPVFKKP